MRVTCPEGRAERRRAGRSNDASNGFSDMEQAEALP
jgi:hypothetical protein